MSEPKTTATTASVRDFLDGVADEQRRTDAIAVCDLFQEVTGVEPVLWGTSIVGFGRYRYEYASGRTGEWPAVGFSPRAKNLTIYISAGFGSYDELMGRLGRYTTGKSCLYLRRLSDVDQDVLRTLIKDAFNHLNGRTVGS